MCLFHEFIIVDVTSAFPPVYFDLPVKPAVCNQKQTGILFFSHLIKSSELHSQEHKVNSVPAQTQLITRHKVVFNWLLRMLLFLVDKRSRLHFRSADVPHLYFLDGWSRFGSPFSSSFSMNPFRCVYPLSSLQKLYGNEHIFVCSMCYS